MRKARVCGAILFTWIPDGPHLRGCATLPPSLVRARAALNEWCYFVMTELDAGSLYIVRRHDGLAAIYGEAPVAVESAKTYFLHNLEAMTPKIGRVSVSIWRTTQRRRCSVDDLPRLGGCQ